MFKPISGNGKLSLEVAKELERSILNKQFLPDQPLPSEARLCEAFAVSRTVVREAIQQLKSQGIIHSIPGSGNYISRNNTANLKRSISLLASLNEGTPLYLEILQLRELLEIDCLTKVCEQDNSDLISELKEHIQTMEENFHLPEVFGQADHAFHLSIIKASNNNLFSTILESLYDSFLKISLQVYDSEQSLKRIVQEHKTIADAIQAKNSELATKLLLQHIHESKRSIE